MCDVLDKLLRSKNASKGSHINVTRCTINENDVLADVIACSSTEGISSSSNNNSNAVSDITTSTSNASIDENTGATAEGGRESGESEAS